jgi:iron(III) transport system permease protein
MVFLSPAVPSIVAAVAFQYFGIAIYRWVPIYGTIWLIALALGTRMLAFCTRTINAASWQLHRQLDEAAYVSGVSRLRTFRGVFLPMVEPALAYSALMVGLLSMRELTLPLLMDGGKTPVVATLVFQLQSNGNHDVAAAVAIYMIAILIVLVLLASRLPAGSWQPRRRWGRQRPFVAFWRRPIAQVAGE